MGPKKKGTKKKGVKKKKATKKKKRPLNAYFKLMLEAKKTGAKSFKYKGKTYVAKKVKNLGVVYKRK